MGRAQALARDQQGVVYIEFLLAFVPLFVLFLGLVQLSLMHAGRLIVQQAAREGVRAAAVVLPDHPARYGEAPMGELVPEAPEEEPAEAREQETPEAQRVLEQLGVPLDIELPDPPWDPPHPGPRMAAIQRAVYFRLSALAPTFEQLFGLLHERRTVAAAIDDGTFTRALTGTLFYGAAVTAIRFPVEPGSTEAYETTVGDDPGLLHLRVTYLFRCAVPIAAWLMCDGLSDLGVSWRERDIADSDDDPLLRADLEHIPSRTGLRLLALSPQRFRVLREEASFPYQSAAYDYPEPEDEEE